jgi:transcriptional regulator with GAF, ATPase, and Fis domain
VLLGSLPASIFLAADVDAARLGLAGNDAFRSTVDAEIERSRFFERCFALLLVQPLPGRHGHLPRWCARVRREVRPVDRVALYGGSTIEILLPEVAAEQAAEMARALIAPHEGEPALAAGVAAFPDAGTVADELVEAALAAVRRADPAAPLQTAETHSLRTLAPEGAADEEGPILQSPAMRSAVELVPRLSRSAIPVLLLGETGAGKEVIARLIHESGSRRPRPLVAVNCGAIPAQLVEGTLFGHEKGSFTGAMAQQKGVFEAADGGTVLLDEVGELPAAAQAALLRVLETKRVVRVGSTREIEVDVRLVAATHRDLEAMCASGAFRSDLYYRISTMVLHVPPLRERREDIPLLAARFLRLAAAAEGGPQRTVDPEALELLVDYPWPGNVRELRNAVERAVVVADGARIGPRDLPERIRARKGAPERRTEPAPAEAQGPAVPEASTGSLKERMERFERDTLIAALRAASGSQSEAARLLDVPLRTFQHKIKAHGIRKVYGASE